MQAKTITYVCLVLFMLEARCKRFDVWFPSLACQFLEIAESL